MPSVSWATQLGFDIKALESERPTDWFQTHLAELHTKRGEAFAEFQRLHRTGNLFRAEIIAWELYCGLTRTVCDFTGAPIPVGIIAREFERKSLVEEAVLKNTCTRCGFIWDNRHPHFIDGLCASCLAVQEKVLRRGRLACQPWQGRFAADDVTPVDVLGNPVLPGIRLCNKSDCVNPKHVTKGKKRNG